MSIEDHTEIGFLQKLGTWRDAANGARTTVKMEPGEKEPSLKWKKQILLAEHSPIRLLMIKAKWVKLLSWVSVHFVRHKYGIEHFVSTQRSDRTGVDRNSLTQDNKVDHEFLANYQAIITISRKRLCSQASKETRSAWISFLNHLKKEDEILYDVCVPECIYRGFCPEFNSCGYVDSYHYKIRVEEYRRKL